MNEGREGDGAVLAGPLSGGEMELVDADLASETRLVTSEEPEPIDTPLTAEPPAFAADAVANLTLSPVNIQRAHEVMSAFEESADPGEVGERLLRELVGGEVAVARQLTDIEGALAVLLGRTITDPELSLAVTKTLKEAVALSSAVRRRVENSLSAAATLRAQRLLLAAHCGRYRG